MGAPRRLDKRTWVNCLENRQGFLINLPLLLYGRMLTRLYIFLVLIFNSMKINVWKILEEKSHSLKDSSKKLSCYLGASRQITVHFLRLVICAQRARASNQSHLWTHRSFPSSMAVIVQTWMESFYSGLFRPYISFYWICRASGSATNLIQKK
jgi:hypothetical protein